MGVHSHALGVRSFDQLQRGSVRHVRKNAPLSAWLYNQGVRVFAALRWLDADRRRKAHCGLPGPASTSNFVRAHRWPVWIPGRATRGRSSIWLQAPLQALGISVSLIGGAMEAGELDAKRAIRQGTEVAAAL